MRRSEAEELARVWSAGEGKVFRYSRPLLPDEYVVFHRIGPTFVCDLDASTYPLKNYTKDEFILMLINGEIHYVRDMTYSVNPMVMKTGGCTCGCWILKDSDYFHDEKCPRYKKKD